MIFCIKYKTCFFAHSPKFCPQTIINAPVSSVSMCPLTSAAQILHVTNTALFAEGNTSPFSTDTVSVAFSTGLLKGSKYSKKTPKAIHLITHIWDSLSLSKLSSRQWFKKNSLHLQYSSRKVLFKPHLCKTLLATLLCPRFLNSKQPQKIYC